MADEYRMDVHFSDLDLNQEPSNPRLHRVERYGSLLNELETSHDRIEDRIRKLEFVYARTRLLHQLQQTRISTEMTSFPSETMVDVGQRTHNFQSSERGKGCKRDSSHLVAKALEEMDSGIKNPEKEGGSFYDCNICLRTRISTEMSSFPSETMVDEGQRRTHNFKSSERGRGCKRDSSHLVAKALEEMDSGIKKHDKEGGSFYCNICLEVAKKPVLTCCGHLFCWSCFYRASAFDSTSKECPVCKRDVSGGDVIPISELVFEMGSGLMIPPRLKARRVESVRQYRVTQGLSLSLSLSRVPVAEAIRLIRISIGAIDNQTHQVSGVLSESAASLSSLSSARLLDDLEAVIHNRLLRNDARAVIQPNRQFPASTADTNVTSLPITSLQSTDVATSILRTRVSSDVSLPLPPSFRRRTLT